MRKVFFGNREEIPSTKHCDSECDSDCGRADQCYSGLKKHKYRQRNKHTNSRYLFENLIAEQTNYEKNTCFPKSEEIKKNRKSKQEEKESKTCRCPSCIRHKTWYEKKYKGVFSTVIDSNKPTKYREDFESDSSKDDQNESHLIVNENNKEVEYQKPETLPQQPHNCQKKQPRSSGDDIVTDTEEQDKLNECPANKQQQECGDMAQIRQSTAHPQPSTEVGVQVQGVKEAQNKQVKTCSVNKESVFPFKNTPSGNLKVVPQQVVFESKQLSIVAANPNHTKVNVKTDQTTDMSGSNGFDIQKSGFPFMTLDPNSENYKNWKSNGPFVQVRNEDGDANASFRADLPGRSKMRALQSRADGDFPSYETEHSTDSEVAQVFNKHCIDGVRNNVVSLQPEINLTKMGFSENSTVDWTKIELPMKTDLHKLLHHRISNYLNPDVLIKIGNHEYRCHLLVLQCYSDYFNDKPASRIEIPEDCVTKNAFMYLYDWMIYLGQDSYQLLRRDNILEVFMAAQYLGVKELEEQCWAFIDNEDLFSEDKAFMLYLDAKNRKNTSVMELMVPRIQSFFLTLVSSKDFLDLVIEEVCVFLRSNYICIHGEMEVFMSGVRWLMYDWEKRNKHLLEVMGCVRFGLIAPWQLVDIRRNPESEEFLFVTKSPEVSQMIEDGLAFAIIKYWYGHESSDYCHWIDLLGLSEPVGRNWAGTDKNYLFYREFLADLDIYRRTQMLEKKQSKCVHKIDDTSAIDCNEFNESTQLLPPPPPVPCSNRNNLPIPTMAEFVARPQHNNPKVLMIGKQVQTHPRSLQRAHNQFSLLFLREGEHKQNKTASFQKIRIVENNLSKSRMKKAERIGKYEEIVHQRKSKFLPQLGYNETKLLKRMIREQERLDMELRHDKDKQKYKENKRRKEDLKNKMETMLGINADEILNNVKAEVRNDDLKTRPFSKMHNFKTMFNLREKSAVTIQSAFRGYLARKLFKELRRNRKKSNQLFKSKSVPTLFSSVKSYTASSSAEKNYMSPDSLFFPEEEAVLVFGGMDPHTDYDKKRNSAKNIYRYLPKSNNWDLVGEMPEPLHHHGAAFYKGKVIIAGGKTPEQVYKNSDAVTRTVWCFDPATRGWSHMPSLLHPRTNFGLVTCKGKLYAIGGQDHKDRFLKSVEMYDAQTGHWTFVDNLHIGRSGLAAAKFKDQIWVAGGIIQIQPKGLICTSSVETYDCSRNVWYTMESLRYSCCHSVLFPTNDRLYLIGGCVGDRRNHVIGSVNIIDMWDPHNRRWCFRTQMKIPRHAHSVCYRDTQMIVVGGVSSVLMRALKSTEFWDIQEGVWLENSAKLPKVLSGQSSISLPPASLL